MEKSELCLICGVGTARLMSTPHKSRYRGHSRQLPLYFMECDTCTSEYAGSSESTLNKEAMLKFQAEIDTLLDI